MTRASCTDPARARSRRRGHGEGSIRQRPDGRWEGALTIGQDNGRQKRRYVYGKTRREVVDKLDSLRGSVREGLALAPGRQTVGGFLDDWLVEAEPARGVRTMARYRTVARLYLKPRVGYLKLSQIGPQHIQALQRELLA